MKTLVMEYTNEEKLVKDVEEIENRGVPENNIYVLAHHDGHTDHIANKANANTIGIKEMGLKDTINKLFKHRGEELRSKIEDMGVSRESAEMYERKLDEGRILLFITDTEKIQDWM